ncbi:MAG: hypothetical protein Q7U60_12225 [Candidatus Methanoperedens sp.]|nr:hypothetical protein [Candidatus Methanoperedens sp.]
MQEIELESEDLQAALKELRQYVDVTEEDLKKIYTLALRHAKERLTRRIPVSDVPALLPTFIDKFAGDYSLIILQKMQLLAQFQRAWATTFQSQTADYSLHHMQYH